MITRNDCSREAETGQEIDMIEWYELHFDKETEDKYRWRADIDGVKFELYLPKISVPDPRPDSIMVVVEHGSALYQRLPRRPSTDGLVAFADLNEEHTETVRYTPHGDPKTWLMGEPYLPMPLLGEKPWPKRVRISVRWAN